MSDEVFAPQLVDWCFDHGAARSSTPEALIAYCWIGVALNEGCTLRRAEVREYREDPAPGGGGVASSGRVGRWV